MAISTFAYVTYIRATREKLWSALTNVELMKRYLFGMSEAHIVESIRRMIGRASGNAAAGAVHFLSLAATPTFAIMALLVSVGPPDMLCSAAQSGSPLNGMVVMYLLMSAFHSAPWLKLISSRRFGARRA